MRALVILFAIWLPLAYSAINYASTDPFCTTTNPPEGIFKSPILIKPSLCAPYGTFELSMPDATINAASFSGTTGAYQQAYGDATLTVNGTEYKSSSIQFRSNAEHVLFDAGNEGALEIQIEMSASNTPTAGLYPVAFLSFIVKQVGASEHAGISNSNNFRILGTEAGSLKLNFKEFSSRIMSKQAEEVYLNMFTYTGTKTYDCNTYATWFVYGSELTATAATIQLIQGTIQSGATAATAAGVTLSTGDQASNSRTWDSSKMYGGGGAQEVMRLCYTGYFKNYISDNYGLWFGVGSILIFFIFTLSLGERPIKAYDYVENVWTHHPLVSIWKYGNDIHTRKTRCSLILCMWTVICLFASVFYRDASDPFKNSNIIVFAIYAMLINWVITFSVGNILRSYYEAKYEYHKTKEESWDQKAQNRLFGFYISVFIIVVVGWPFTTWNMGELYPEINEEPSKLWVASVFIALGMEMIIFYPLVCMLAKGSNFVRRIAKSEGFMYDKICHETYLDYMKSD